MSFPDAVAAAPVAVANGWPLYICPPDHVPAGLVSAMSADGVERALLLGGRDALAEGVALTLRDAALQVHRLSGATRYETAVEIARYGVAESGLTWNGLGIASGSDFPDALAGGVLLGREGSVVLLTDRQRLSRPTAAELVARRSDITMVRYLGGVGAVSLAVRDEVAATLR
jgi:putative cell wall-binding protein